MELSRFNELIKHNTEQDIKTKNVEVVIHMGSGIILDVNSLGTDGQGTIYIDCDGSEYLKLISNS